MGVDVDDDSIADKSGEGVVDLMSTKESALRLAVDAAVTVLRVRLDLSVYFSVVVNGLHRELLRFALGHVVCLPLLHRAHAACFVSSCSCFFGDH